LSILPKEIRVTNNMGNPHEFEAQENSENTSFLNVTASNGTINFAR